MKDNSNKEIIAMISIIVVMIIVGAIISYFK